MPFPENITVEGVSTLLTVADIFSSKLSATVTIAASGTTI